MIPELISQTLRKWMIKGQADYRAGNPKPEGMNATEEEGWNMGWYGDQADEIAGRQPSVLGKIDVRDENADLRELQGPGLRPHRGPSLEET